MIAKYLWTLILFLSLASPSGAAMRTLLIDPTRSYVGFSVSNWGVNNVEGHFTRFNGQIHYDPGDFTHSSAEVMIQVDSIDTKSKKRDHHLRDKDFFEVARFPEMTFKSQSIERVDDRYQMTGLLSIKEHSKAIPVLFSFQETTSTDGKPGLRAEGKAVVNRRDFGINYGNAFMVGNNVQIHLKIEAY